MNLLSSLFSCLAFFSFVSSSHSVSVFFLCLSVSVCLCLSLSPCAVVVVLLLCCGVSCCVVLCLVLCCGVVWCVVCDTLKNPVCSSNTSPYVRSKRPRVYRHHTHTCFNTCAWCRHTRKRFGRTHGTCWTDTRRRGRGRASSSSSCFSSVKQVIFDIS